MTLDEIMRDIQAWRGRTCCLLSASNGGADGGLLRKAYQRGEEPDDPAWVLDWSEWAATQQLLQEQAGCHILRIPLSPGTDLLITSISRLTSGHPHRVPCPWSELLSIDPTCHC